jgi:indole-3-glycerol phosphate synthase
MKDIIIDEVQIQSAKDSGADCVLLIEQIFSKHYVASMEKLITAAHHHTLEVLLEAHNQNELQTALASGADIIGVNNRNLSTLKTDLQTTPRLLRGLKERNNKPIISESGIETSGDIRTLRKIPVDGFLIGSSLMLSPDLESKVREFTLA